MKTFLFRPALAPLFAALVLAGCANVPDVDPQALAAAPAAFKETTAAANTNTGRWVQAAPAEAADRGAWWRVFNDPQLDALIAQAATHNTSIAEAASRLAQAQALLRTAKADQSVQISANGGINRAAGADTAGGSVPASLGAAGLRFSYELDLFGKLSRATNAASLDAQGRAALLQSTRLLVQADVAQTYLALRSLDAERALVRETVAAYRDTLRLTERRQQAGDLAELDVARASTEVASTESDALALDRQRAALEHALAVLVGESASSFSVQALDQADWRAALPIIPTGVPATVLTRRPDISAAQSNLLAAQARVGVAQTAWYPNVSLTAAGGYASTELGDVFSWGARAWGVGALLSLPIFDGGRREAGVAQAQAQLDGASAAYRGQVLGAFKEVEDQLAALRLLSEQTQAQDRAVESATRATRISDVRYRNGLVSQLDLLDARRSELRNRRQAVEVRSAQYQSTVMLIRALGGGWDVPVQGTVAAPQALASANTTN
ncbi:efflux transporter outer membrane subunit [Variovorax sp. HJSM1_2]|uniref:efflux transporter outer membrane subunit n=1 Tax=Variovorax sp. HJSM1_2 TaxID=3366263 RepID=UPI003BD0C08B